MQYVLRCKRGEGYVDVVVIVLVVMLGIALAIKVFPVFIAKNQLDRFADELVREAEIAGRVGQETSSRAIQLKSQTILDPTISWSKTGNLQISEEVTVTLHVTMNIGLFGNFGSFPIDLTAKATGRSEVYWK